MTDCRIPRLVGTFLSAMLLPIASFSRTVTWHLPSYNWGNRPSMRYDPIDFDRYENTNLEPVTLHGIVRLNPGARIIKSRVLGPFYSNRNSQLGPDVVVG